MTPELYKTTQAKLHKLCDIIIHSDRGTTKEREYALARVYNKFLKYEMSEDINWDTLMEISNKYYEDFK